MTGVMVSTMPMIEFEKTALQKALEELYYIGYSNELYSVATVTHQLGVNNQQEITVSLF